MVHEHLRCHNGQLSIQRLGCTPLEDELENDPDLAREVAENKLVLREEELKLIREKDEESLLAKTKSSSSALELSPSLIALGRRTSKVVRGACVRMCVCVCVCACVRVCTRASGCVCGVVLVAVQRSE